MQRTWRHLYAAIPLLIIVALIVVSCWRSPQASQAGAIARGETIVRAIDAYAGDNDRYPAQLLDLVPKYLPEAPGSGAGAYRVDYTRQDYGTYQLDIGYDGPGVNNCTYDPARAPEGWKCGGHF
ncbi:hypothetical protein LYSHEL_20800 [Lysobacter helvus]|uniref:Type II secretion system protein G n=2 Tax=Lysobacteraceae TaxID=32033 RepID=A0ABM7Q6V3_9GAMM|nr:MULTISPECIES: hypothetical protein [Lysobacter]BCT93057.1 hypothetical protein LYSCAS_20810 [Lysobacter caseinilyticus]BCT96209.1 hypothetical protein LYSHEL_20800 [Lysobacter helvus]